MRKLTFCLIAITCAALNMYADAPKGVEMVDLGLPSGTLWANMNVGATTPEGYGDYFAWGETSPKTTYDWSTYKHCQGSENNLIKYCTDSIYGIVDNKAVLDLEDDAAHVNWGGNWRMPTKAEQDELRTKCTWTWTQKNSINGYDVKGPNGNSIFLPASGYRFGSSLYYVDSYGYGWSSSLYSSYSSSAYNLSFNSDSVVWIYYDRYSGLSVRPVISPASNIITYTATEKLPEITDTVGEGLHVNAFNVTITSHEFSNGTGILTFDGEVTTIGSHAFYNCSSLTSITIPNSVTTIGDWAFARCSNLIKTNYTGTIADWCKIYFSNSYANPMVYSHNFYINDVEVKDLVIPAGVDTIGGEAFARCDGLTSVTIPNSVTAIGWEAFWACHSLTSITCYATNPPTCGGSCFESVDKSIPVYVPAQSVNAYKQAEEWKAFTNILPIGAEEVPATEPIITPDNNSVTITWPQTENADTYTLEIRKNGELFCTITFNNQGVMIDITFAAPARNGVRTSSAAEMTSNGYKFTINGLEPGTEYTYAVIAKDASAQPLQTYSGSFETTMPTGLEDLTIDKNVGNKFIYGNHLYILRDGNLFTATGARVK